MKLVSASAQAETQLRASKKRLEELPAKIRQAAESGDVKKLSKLRQQQIELQDTIKAQEIILVRLRLNEMESERLGLAEQLKEAQETQLKAQRVNTDIRDALDNAGRLYNYSVFERVNVENRLKQNSDDIRQARAELEKLLAQVA
jgi:hypothetical protein